MFFNGHILTQRWQTGTVTLGDFLMKKLIGLISRTKSVSMRASEARPIYITANAMWLLAINKGISLWATKNRLIQSWLDTRCFCGRFRRQLYLIKEKIKKNKRWISKCLQKAFQWNHCIDAYYEADASHFKLMVDKKCFAMSNCTYTLQPIMCSENRRWIPFGRVTVSP